MKKHLLPREWFAVTFLLTIILFIIGFKLINQLDHVEPRGKAKTYLVEMITVNVEGRVVNPGVYTLKKDSKLSDLLKYIELEEDVDISKLNYSKKISNNQTIKIE